MILRNQIFRIGRAEAIRIRSARKATREDFVVAILAILLTPPEKLHVCSINRSTGDRIGDVVHRALFNSLAADRGIRDPQDNASLIAIMHFCRDPVGSRFLQRRRHSHHRIEVIIRSLQIQFPLRDRFFEILCFIVTNQHPADVVDLQFHAIQLLRLAFDIFADVGQQFVNPDRPSIKRRFVAVAISNIERRAFSGGLHRGAFNLHPVPDDLVDASLHNLPVILVGCQFQDLAMQIGGLPVLMPIHAFVDKTLQSLAF